LPANVVDLKKMVEPTIVTKIAAFLQTSIVDFLIDVLDMIYKF
jgi:hypothetical protein